MANVTLNVTDNKGQAAGSIEAPADFFGFSAEEVQAHVPMIHQVVAAQLAAARQGSIRAPQWYHGGVVHGPVPRDYSQRTPKKMKAAALKYVLSDRVNNGRVAVVDFGITEPSTKAALAALNPIVADNFTTVVLSRDNINEWLSVRNIPTVHPIFADQLNTYDVVTAQYVVFSKEGYDAFLEAKKPAEKEA